jgi:Peptidase S24-like
LGLLDIIGVNMVWASSYIAALTRGETVKFRPRGNSMTGKIESGQLVTVAPITDTMPLKTGMIVLCRVNGQQYLHLIKAVSPDNRYLIGNNRGKTNGWTSRSNIFGICVFIEN